MDEATLAMNPLHLNRTDRLLATLNNALATLAGALHSSRLMPQAVAPAQPLSPTEQAHAGALMRINHVGEICAQALYQAQALTARTPELRDQMLHAAQEEEDHLVWTQQRLEALHARPSLLNPLWYAGAFAIGCLAGRLGDKVSLGFVVETERQVEAHLASHLQTLPEQDVESRAVVEQMQADEARHAYQAQAAGAVELPRPVKWLMKGAAKVMTTVAYRV